MQQMYNRYIFEIKLGNTEGLHPREDEIVEYAYFRVNPNSREKFEYRTIKKVLHDLTQSGDRFFTYSKALGKTMRECKWEQTIDGEWFLRTIPNGTEIDNLLSLPRY